MPFGRFEEENIENLGARIGILAIVICAIVFVIGLLIGTKALHEALEMLDIITYKKQVICNYIYIYISISISPHLC